MKRAPRPAAEDTLRVARLKATEGLFIIDVAARICFIMITRCHHLTTWHQPIFGQAL
jgi:hypothetical protein